MDLESFIVIVTTKIFSVFTGNLVRIIPEGIPRAGPNSHSSNPLTDK